MGAQDKVIEMPAYTVTIKHAQESSYMHIKSTEFVKDVNSVYRLIDAIADLIKPGTKIPRLPVSKKFPELVLRLEYIPVYIYQDEEIECGICYYIETDKFKIGFVYACEACDPLDYVKGAYEIYFDIGWEADQLTEEDAKMIAYLVGYTHYCIAHGYSFNTDPEKILFDYRLKLRALPFDEYNKALEKPVGYIFKVNVPFLNINEIDKLLKKATISYYC